MAFFVTVVCREEKANPRTLVLDADMSTRFLVCPCSLYFCPSARPQHEALAELEDGERPLNSYRSVKWWFPWCGCGRGQNIEPEYLPLNLLFLFFRREPGKGDII